MNSYQKLILEYKKELEVWEKMNKAIVYAKNNKAKLTQDQWEEFLKEYPLEEIKEKVSFQAEKIKVLKKRIHEEKFSLKHNLGFLFSKEVWYLIGTFSVVSLFLFLLT